MKTPTTYKALIIDDEPAAREILTTHLKKIDVITVVGVCKNASEGFTHLSKQQVDLIFLDINMPEISGLSFAKALQKETKVIFTTAYREYAVDGFDLQAVDYLLKPISLERLIKAINKFLGEHIVPEEKTRSKITSEATNYMFVRADRRMIKIMFEEILFIESLSDYLKIHTTEKTITTRETISNILTRLPTSLFVRSHRSYIVNLLQINSFTNEVIEIENNAIPISRSYKKDVVSLLNTTI